MKISPLNSLSFGAMVVSLESRLGQHRSVFAVRDFDTQDVLDIDFKNKQEPIFTVKGYKGEEDEHYKVKPMFADLFEAQYNKMKDEPTNIQIGVQRITKI